MHNSSRGLLRPAAISLVAILAHLCPILAHSATVPGDFPTIQAAINAITAGTLPSGTVIDVQPGTYREALVVQNTARSLTVRATAGPASTVVDASGRGVSTIRVINVTGTVRFEGFTVTGGSGGPGANTGGGFTVQDASPTFANMIFEGNASVFHGGGGLLLRSSAVFESCTFQNNSVGVLGGGVFVWMSNPLFMNTTIRNNISGLVDPMGSGGGAAVQDGHATFRSSVITGNRTVSAGGGIYVFTPFTSPGPSVVTLQDTEISANTASRMSAGMSEAFGGGIHIEDNAIARLTRVRVTGNTANSGGGLSTFRARFEVTSSYIESNQALDDPTNLLSGLGGGVIAVTTNRELPFRPSAAVIMTDSVVRNNTAREGGGVWAEGDLLCGGGPCSPATAPRTQLTVTTSLIDGNTAVQPWAGGIFGQRANVSIAQSQIFRNRVTGSAARGGGLTLLASSGTITDSTLADNSAPAEGGGLYADLESAITVDRSNLYRNSAGTRGGAIFAAPTATGVVQNSVIADNIGIQVAEDVVCSGTIPALRYSNNVLVAQGTAIVYRSNCNPPGDLTVAGLNALPGGRASGNTSATPVFASFRATPAERPSVLAWSVARATSITITNVGAVSAPTGTQDVNPACDTTFVLTSNTPSGSVSTTATCPVASTATLTISPPTGHLTAQQAFDLALIVETAAGSVTAMGATLDGQDVSGALRACAIAGTLVGAGKTLRCPAVSGALLGTGPHTFTATVFAVDGATATQSVMWTVNQPPPNVTLSPPSGSYVSAQGFDLVIIVNALGRAIASGSATFDGADVIAPLLSCVQMEVLPTGPVAFRCPGLRVGMFSSGSHTLSVTVQFSDGTSATGSVTWQFRPNTEP